MQLFCNEKQCSKNNIFECRRPKTDNMILSAPQLPIQSLFHETVDYVTMKLSTSGIKPS